MYKEVACCNIGSKSYSKSYRLNKKANCFDDDKYRDKGDRGSLGKKMS